MICIALRTDVASSTASIRLLTFGMTPQMLFSPIRLIRGHPDNAIASLDASAWRHTF